MSGNSTPFFTSLFHVVLVLRVFLCKGVLTFREAERSGPPGSSLLFLCASFLPVFLIVLPYRVGPGALHLFFNVPQRIASKDLHSVSAFAITPRPASLPHGSPFPSIPNGVVLLHHFGRFSHPLLCLPKQGGEALIDVQPRLGRSLKEETSYPPCEGLSFLLANLSFVVQIAFVPYKYDRAILYFLVDVWGEGGGKSEELKLNPLTGRDCQPFLRRSTI